MKKLSGFFLMILVAVILLALSHGIGGAQPIDTQIGVTSAKSKVPVCHNPRNWHPILVDEHAVPALLAQGDFIIDETNPCPPDDDSNPNPAPPQDPVDPPGPQNPGEGYRLYLPVEFHDNGWYCPVGLCD